MPYDPQKIEEKWQRIWEEKEIFYVDFKKAKKPFYNLMMFPYPSAEGLHVGNAYAFTGSDIYGRFRRMLGFDVFEPMGFDAFGIHSENYAIKKGIHPKILIKKNTDNFRRQLKNLGCLFDWRHEVDTTRPEYYKWTQWLFLQLFKAGLAYRKKAPVDWCPSCKTVLADEQVIGGKCERCDSQVIQKQTEQWFLEITKYAEKLLKNLDWIDWSERTKIAQKHWIGKSEGWTTEFKIKDSEFKIPVFTTRTDTLFGCTYLVVSPEHPIIQDLKHAPYRTEGSGSGSQISNLKSIERYIEKSTKRTERERISDVKEKSGIEILGVKAVNPVNNREIPIFVADYVLAHYATGAIMAVPCHDQRDFDFAKKYNLAMIEVIKPSQVKKALPKRASLVISDGTFKEAYEGEGFLINSGRFDGLSSQKAIERIGEYLAKKNFAKKTIYYKLRDWLISRQRYWGVPIPMVFCQNCASTGGSAQAGWQPVPEKDLPVFLPDVKDFRPKGTGQSPLASVKSFVNTKCPKCGGPAKRETDVSDTFLDSSWYFLRYPSSDFENKSFDKALTKKWLPIDMYIGGQEHAVLHLLYTRFIMMALKDLGFVDFEEPFKKFRAHGLLTKGGAKMSKSKGNVVNPDEYYKKYGADTLRMYLMFIGPFSEGGDWQDKGIVGIRRFLERVCELKNKVRKEAQNDRLNVLVNKTIKKITEDLETFQYNTAISSLMILVNEMMKEKEISFINYSVLLTLLAPFAPYITEELWYQIGNNNSIHNQSWPKYNPKLIKEEKAILVIQINGRIRDKIEVQTALSEKKAKELALSLEKIKKWTEGKKIKKIIFVPGKLINIVI